MSGLHEDIQALSDKARSLAPAVGEVYGEFLVELGQGLVGLLQVVEALQREVASLRLIAKGDERC